MHRAVRSGSDLALAIALAVSLSAPTSGQASKSPSAAPLPESAYAEGATFASGQPVKLNAAGNRLVVARISPPQGSSANLAIEIRVLGEADVLAFTWGQTDSGITLLAGDQRLAATSAQFGDDVVARFSQETLVTHMTTSSRTGTLVLDTTERPLIVLFRVPDELAGSTRLLELRKFGVGEGSYVLNVKLQD